METGFTFPDVLIDTNFAETEAKWASLAEPYDNLSKLPPKQTSNYYIKTTKKGTGCQRSVHAYSDPWPVKNTKKKKDLSPDKYLTAGVALDDRETFNQELFDHAQELDPDHPMDISEIVAAKNRRIAQVQKDMLSGKGPAAAQAQKEDVPNMSSQPTPINSYNTRSRMAKISTTTQKENLAAATTGTGAAANSEGSTIAPSAASEDSLRIVPPIMQKIMMRNTRELSAENARLSGPLRGVIFNSYYASNAQASSSRSPPVGDEPDETPPAADQTPADEQLGENSNKKNMQQENHTADNNNSAQDHLPKANKKRTAVPNGKPSKIPEEPKLRRAIKACENCRTHKTRCEGGVPCKVCVKRGFECIFAPGDNKPPGKRPREPKPDSDSDDDSNDDTRPAKRARKQEGAPAAKTKESTKAKQSTKAKGATEAKESTQVNESTNGKESTKSTKVKKASAKRVRKESEQVETQPTKRQRSIRGQAEGALDQTPAVEAEPSQPAQPTQTQPAKPQSFGGKQRKRALEDVEDIEARPAKQQRKSPHITWHTLYPAVDKTVLNGEGSMSKAFPLEDQPFSNKDEIINWNTQEDSFHNRPSIKLAMPDLLKAILVDDWEHVTKDQQLVPIPHEHPVDEVLKDYLDDEKFKREEGSTQMDILEETIAGLREYFDRALGRILLYRFERLQYSEKRAEWDANANAESPDGPSTTYGAEHLCRLLVSLPELIGQTNMDQQSVSRLREEITKFSNWLSKNSEKYFVRQYEDPGAEYIEKARNT